MSESGPSSAQARGVVDLYYRALPQVYGYLLARCHGDVHLAEELTAETFLAAVDSAARGSDTVTVGWLITVARNKLVDHWRRSEREERRYLRLAAEELVKARDAWDIPVHLDVAQRALSLLRGPHRAVLTLRYIDGLSVADTAGLLDRSIHATEGLIVRARAAFRRLYDQERKDADA